MTAATVSPRNVAYSVLIALQEAEARLMPDGAHSRLYAAVSTTDAAVRFLSNPTSSARADLVSELETLKEIESAAANLGQLPKGSLISLGISIAIYVAQTTLAGYEWSSGSVLREAQSIYRLAQQIEAAA